MQKVVRMYRLEEETGKDIRQIIYDAVQEHGSVAAAAESFGMTRQALGNWISLLDGHTETRVETRSEVCFDGWSPAVDDEQPQEEPAVA